MGETFAGRYELVDVLGDGGMGTVWRAWDHRDRQYRAVKLLKQSDSTSLMRFVRETSRRIDHDHIVTPLAWSAEDDRVLFTMPLVGGGTVAHLLKDFGALPTNWVVELVDQLLQGLQAVHEVGLVHRDVKPGNLLLDATGSHLPHLRLTDFGIAADVGDPRLTRAGDVLGTPGYQAPEALRGADPDPRQDLYSVGVVAVELLTGRRPTSPPAPAPPGVSSGPLGPFVRRLTAVDPDQRFASAAEALTELRAQRLLPERADDSAEVEVFDQLPPLPPGWGGAGPVAVAAARATTTGSPPGIRDQAGPTSRSRLPALALVLTILGVVCLVLGLMLV